jgi:glutamyl-Q tRNA(Asp) synthetase
VSVSTATATTATAEVPRPGARARAAPAAYIGRFAPSPNGALHLGSLLAAVGSFVDARSHGGRWLVRMEDLDSSRAKSGCADRMLHTLEAFGLTWDGSVEYQSGRTEHYRRALQSLVTRGLTFECSCSRRERGTEGGYPGTCRQRPVRAGPTAVRFRVDHERVISFRDRLQGSCTFSLRERGDAILRRRDGAFSYQLAVVVDDALQAVTDVVRGADLLDSTPWQLALQEALGLTPPRYAHLPVVVEPSGAKLAKSRRSVGLDPASAGPQLQQTLALLRQEPPAELKLESPGTILDWACRNWRPERFGGTREVRAPA